MCAAGDGDYGVIGEVGLRHAYWVRRWFRYRMGLKVRNNLLISKHLLREVAVMVLALLEAAYLGNACVAFTRIRRLA